ncbi:mitochondrial ribosomal protein L23 [Gloeophyllum trabeum ATCC 11539]|uniref:Large ribosomal subunit protein uL23m n=1 Tax=Gloeophyllum trabeum (strain ATCC 11539 / FP-39264 / Madison 617) TaxID=670483 RepID=S7QB50_GLOTA|nr:mitochondrial ribosomal protein L23 [Gloeophyllum trabeum ATCC 11539]EPQ56558.1 mitochondrial ribosomal protein L23 [Gloeophyllum trabeum ATCC 11539]
MQSLSKCFTRLYATIPQPAAVARTASTPRQVRLRRLRKRKAPVPPGKSDALPSGATPSEHDRYRRLRALGELVTRDGAHEYSEEEWLDKLNSQRTRIRGIVQVKQGEDAGKKKIVGQRVYLPNLVFRLVRNHTPPGQPYNPYEATFRVPQSVTKNDVRGYLASVYGVKTTYIRTDNYLSPVYRGGNGSWSVTKSYKTYKRAVVGLVDPFYYPQALEDMHQEEREARQKWIEDKFGLEKIREYRQYILLRMTRKNSKDWKWSGVSPNRRTIMKKIGLARSEREAQIHNTKKMILEARASGKPISEVLASSQTEAPAS